MQRSLETKASLRCMRMCTPAQMHLHSALLPHAAHDAARPTRGFCGTAEWLGRVDKEDSPPGHHLVLRTATVYLHGAQARGLCVIG